jgi:hypothetical protein
MDRVESSLCRLRDAVSRFVVPSVALCDVGILRAQIELRQLALEDIEVIRRRLRSIGRCEGGRRRRGSSQTSVKAGRVFPPNKVIPRFDFAKNATP